MKVYIVTAGEYDEYQINSVHTDPIVAYKIADVYEYGAVEEFELDPDYSVYLDYLDQGFNRFLVRLSDPPHRYDYVQSREGTGVVETGALEVRKLNDKDGLRVVAYGYVWAKDEDQAWAIARARLVQYREE